MTIRYQQDSGRLHDPIGPCHHEGCDRRANIGSRWCFRHAPRHRDGTPKRTPPWRCAVDGCERRVSTGLEVCRDHVGPTGGAGEQAAQAVRERDATQLRRHLQLRWERVHAGLAELILDLRREGLDEAADEVTSAMDQIGKATTKACRRHDGQG